MIKIAPSILGADFARMGEQVRMAEEAGADWLHIDVMDGHFVPNLTLGPDMVKAVRKSSGLYLDTHLMVTNPENFFEAFAKAGTELLTFHIEVAPNPDKNIKLIYDLGCKAGLSLNPDTPVEEVLPHLSKVDLVLVMSVFPGYGGQKFIEESLERVSTIKKYILDNSLKCAIQIDGGVNRKTAPGVIAAGVDILVMGSAFFGAERPAELVKELKSL
ncbi:MAG: ribulose-phosphate 3-epimerase [candidate division Zixibacteria bacterium]|nr:ribulose-phosphate 3-epimerase [candidate division Zixibacteria bacterium]